MALVEKQPDFSNIFTDGALNPFQPLQNETDAERQELLSKITDTSNQTLRELEDVVRNGFSSFDTSFNVSQFSHNVIQAVDLAHSQFDKKTLFAAISILFDQLLINRESQVQQDLIQAISYCFHQKSEFFGDLTKQLQLPPEIHAKALDTSEQLLSSDHKLSPKMLSDLLSTLPYMASHSGLTESKQFKAVKILNKYSHTHEQLEKIVGDTAVQVKVQAAAARVLFERAKTVKHANRTTIIRDILPFNPCYKGIDFRLRSESIQTLKEIINSSKEAISTKEEAIKSLVHYIWLDYSKAPDLSVNQKDIIDYLLFYASGSFYSIEGSSDSLALQQMIAKTLFSKLTSMENNHPVIKTLLPTYKCLLQSPSIALEIKLVIAQTMMDSLETLNTETAVELFKFMNQVNFDKTNSALQLQYFKNMRAFYQNDRIRLKLIHLEIDRLIYIGLLSEGVDSLRSRL